MLASRVLDVLFPRRCAGCGSGQWPFCAACVQDVVPIRPPMCSRCGAPASMAVVPSCRSCPPAEIARSRAPFVFDGAIRRAVHRLKFAGDRSVAQALAAAMAASDEFDGDAITWVPLSRSRLAERGYDQAKALAGELEPLLDRPAVRLLRRVSDDAPQARRSGTERRAAMRGAFEPVVPEAGTGPANKILLIDDVLTTGSTAAECARVLLTSGAARVDLLVAARALGRGREYSRSGFPPGSVVARGSSSVVDASRRQNDPRKATLGR
jgi:ComF family protein